ncbi:MAG: creatininase family protein [Alphaproteobacteria bacterium]|nr:creatininase family protein [Alphaproteobacteria bacterium]
MLLHHQTWGEVERYLGGASGIVMPIGSTEQHGPNGLIGTDAITAEAIGRAVGEAVGAMVGPTIGVGMAQHHMAFTGSMTLRPSTLIAVIDDYVTSLARHGFRRFYFVNGHGGNIATVGAAFNEIYARLSLAEPGANRPDVRCKLANWWQGDGIPKLSKELFGDKEGSHATPSEVSVTQFLHPETIKPVGPMTVAPKGGFHDAADYRRRFPDGRIGSDPSLASPAAGKRVFDRAVAELVEDYRKFIAEP